MVQPELRLLVACARAPNGMVDATSIRQMLEAGIDWAVFTRQAMRHGLVALVGNTLEKVAPDVLPDDLMDAFRMNEEHIRSKNHLLCEGFLRSVAALVNDGVDAIWFAGPVLATRAYGDAELRVAACPRLLVREQSATAAITALRSIGYQQKTRLTITQLDFMRYLQGREPLYNRSLGVSAELCIRLTSINMALDIDHQGLWRRTQSTSALGQTVQTLAPEDELLALSIRYGKRTTWQLAEACDFAALIAAQPNLDWATLLARARAQGSLRMLRLAVALSCRYFGANADESRLQERTDPIVEEAVSRTIGQWQADQPGDSLGEDEFSLDLLRLHDGSLRKARYALRSMVLPNAQHVGRIALPRRLTNVFIYGLMKLPQELVALPLLRAARKLCAWARSVRDLMAAHGLGLTILPASKEQRLLWRQHHAARREAERLLAENPNNEAAWHALGDAWFRLGRHAAAIGAYDNALSDAPEKSILLKKRAAAVGASGGRAADDTAEETALTPEDADGWARHAASLAAQKRFAEAIAAADRALAIDPRHRLAMRVGIRCRISSCDWRRSGDDERRVASAFSAGHSLITPAGNRAICDSEAQNLIAAQLWIRPYVLPGASTRRLQKYRHDRIRLAYLSSEYHDHPVGIHLVGVFEQHDRARFETTAISLGGPNASAIRQRIQAACDKFISVHDMSDQGIAEIVSSLEIDIAVDLDRLAARARPGILARRPAPLQVSYFGNAGTTAAPFFDYIVADRTLIPNEQFRYYTENVVYLPNSYQCNDAKRHLPQSNPTRAEVGLPEAAFVYCCFNQSYKIRPAVFEVWMRLLHACPGSVLWLLGDEPYVVHNLRREASARGIGLDRIVFAPLVSNEAHLARHRLADLFLDTLPCNAHVTASDALWTGLPIVTCLGNTFSGRVCASLLRAVDLPEMVTESLSQYEALAASLAREPQRLAAIKAKLVRSREHAPLFDTGSFTHDLEAAFETIWQRQQSDLMPEAIAV